MTAQEGRDQRRPVAQRQQPAQQRTAPAASPRRRSARGRSARPVGHRGRAVAPAPAAAARALGVDLLGVRRPGSSATFKPFGADNFSSGFRRFASVRSAWAAVVLPRFVLGLRPQVQYKRPVVDLAVDRLSEAARSPPAYSPLACASRPSCRYGAPPRARSSVRVSAWLTALAIVGFARCIAVGRSIDLVVDQQRPDQGEHRQPGDGQADDGEAEAAASAVGRHVPARALAVAAPARAGRSGPASRIPGRRGRRPSRGPRAARYQS